MPLTLIRTPTSAPAAALWLPMADTGDLVDALMALGHEPWPRVHALAQGYVLLLDAPDFHLCVPGAVRLRALAAHFLAPLDSELSVALFDDELRALTASRGLVLLPHQVLTYDRNRPLRWSQLIHPGPVTRQAWVTLPPEPAGAERITSITLNLAGSADDLLSAGGGGIGEAPPTPDNASLGDTLKGKANIAAGKALAGLGSFLGIDALARKGADMIGRGLHEAPQLGERFFGSQGAALRDLLRKFREGQVDEALKRAIPFDQQGSRGGTVTDHPGLPFNNISYSLANILGASGRGPGGIWMADADVTSALMAEYRKAAQAAARRGDHRRAAFIYGKLLGDFREAAAVLMAGGLYHDAATLYLQKLNDPLAAAQAFENGGDIDRAVRIYRERHEHVRAGELLKRAGEEEQALGEFRQAAHYLTERGDHLAAGRLMASRAQRSDLARAYFEKGWKERIDANGRACGLELLELYAADEQPEHLLRLVAEAERALASPAHQAETARFFNRLAELAQTARLAPQREELADRALMALAGALRKRHSVSPGAVSELLSAPVWPAPLINDARAAARLASEQPRAREHDSPPDVTQLGRGRLTAACFAQHSDELFAALDNGDVVAMRPTYGAVVTLARREEAALGLAATQDGDLLFILRAGTTPLLSSLSRQAQGYTLETPGCATADDVLLACARAGNDTISLCAKDELISVRRGVPPAVTLVGNLGALGSSTAIAAAFLEPTFHQLDARMALITLSHGDDSLTYYPDLEVPHSDSAVLGWHPAPATGLSVAPPVTRLRTRHDELELCGTNAHGYLFWTQVRLSEQRIEELQTKICGPRHGYRCAAFVKAGQVAAIAEDRVDIYGRQGNEMALKRTIAVDLRLAVAAHVARITEQLMVLCADARLVRVAL